MKKIMFLTLILLLFITCSGAWAENNISDDMIAEGNLNDSAVLQSSQMDDDIPKANESETVDGEYVDASDAYEYLNKFRTEENVWYWNSDDVTQSHVNTNDTVWLKPLERDVELENSAKIRAKEISELFAHVRPDGTNFFTALPNGLLDYGENIAYGYEDGFEVTEGWKETNESYDGQGHRRGMLQASFNYVGIAGYKVGGVIYWVQNFGCRYDPKDLASTSRFRFENNTQNPRFGIDVPNYASGSFDVYVNGILFSTKSISNGKSDISVCGLNRGTYEILLSYSGDYNCNPFNQTETVVIPNHENPSGTLSFNDLNTLIKMAGDEIRLENDYEFKTLTDLPFAEGIEISKSVSIDGQGHSVDAKGMAKIFNIGFYEVTLKNIRLINAGLLSENRYFDSSSYGVTCYSNFRPIRNGGAVFCRFPISIVNSTFSNNGASNGGAVFAYSDVYVDNSTFENNSADVSGGAIYSLSRVYVTNATFKDNHAVDVGGAIYSELVIEATNSLFKNNHNMGIFTKQFINNNSRIVSGEYIDLFVNATSDNGIVTLNRDWNATGTVIINASNVIIDGNGYTIDAKCKSRLFNITGDNVTIKNIRFINGKSIKEGGAIHVSSSCLTILNSTFENCIAQYGGVVYGNWSDIVILNSTFTNNNLTDFSGNEITEGGVITTRTGDVLISNSTFTNNFAFYGAVVHTDSGMISIADSHFQSNLALYYGGIIHSAGDINARNSDFLYNYASLYGGAIFCYGGSRLFVCNSTFTNNTSNHYGGAISADIDAEIIDCVFTNNFASHYAGAICLWGNLSVSNSNFTNNTAEVAAAIFDYFIDGSVTITQSNFINNTQKTLGTLYFTTNVFVRNSTFANNWAYDGVGGAIVSEQNLTVSNSVFANNYAVRSWGYSVGGAIASYGENLNVEDSVFTDSHVVRGGAIANFAKNAVIKNSIFANNSAEKDGGAIFSYDNTNCSVSDSIFENNSADDGGALCGANAVNCTFTQNKATNLASAMYGVSNTAKNCRFFKNLDYMEGPVYDVATTDCTFKDNRFIQKAFFEYCLQLAYYQGENLNVDVLSYPDRTKLLNATVTISAYKDNVLAGKFEYLSGDGWTVNITEGYYTLQFSIENQDYDINPINATVTVIKTEIAKLDITAENVTYSDPSDIEMLSNLNGTAYVYIDGGYMDYFSIVANEKVQMAYYLPAGTHTIEVEMIPSDYHFDSKKFKVNFTVFKRQTFISVDVENASEYENVLLRVNASDNGMIYIKAGDVSQSVYAYAGIETQIRLGIFNPATYELTATFDAGDNYLASNASKTFRVFKEVKPEGVLMSQNKSFLLIGLPAGISGTVTFSIADGNCSVEVLNGRGLVNISNLDEGWYSYVISYSGDDTYAGFSIGGNVYVQSPQNVRQTPEMKVSKFEGGAAQVTLPGDAIGKVTLTIAGNDHVFDVVSGKANVVIPDLVNGNYSYTITYSGDGKYLSVSANGSLAVNKLISTVISASSKVTAVYGCQYYVATLKDANGNTITGLKLTVRFSNGKTANPTTDKDGKIKLTTDALAPKTYTATITFEGNAKYASCTKKVSVVVKKATPKLTASKKTFKKSTKTKKYTITLKTNKNKVMKNTWVTLNVNKKTYKVKTNSKGQATFKIVNLNKKGTFTAVVKYGGNKYYNAKTVKPKITVK